jgi:glycosyltransferase involved in cell wall biosynthesis
VSGAASIVYCTCRAEPAFEWFAESLARQLGDADDVEVVVVDAWHGWERGDRLARAAAGRFAFRHVAAKPSPYSGARRLTTRNFFAAASARNTGLVYAAKPYVVFVDDACVLMDGWWKAAREASREGAVVTGAYRKCWEMRVCGGVLESCRKEPSGVDSRWSLGDARRPVPVGGGQLFGATIGAPRALLLEINGFDELCDSVGGEDWHLGVRLELSGVPIWYDRRMLTIESEELHRQGEPFLRIDRTLPPAAYMERLDEFGVRRRRVDGAFDNSHMLLDVVYGTGSPATQGNYYWLADLDESALPATVRRFPFRHWFDRTPLAEL